VEKAEKIVGLLKERVSFAHEIYQQSDVFFKAPASYDTAVVTAKWNEDAIRAVTAIRDAFQVTTEPLTAESAKTIIAETLAAAGIKQGKVMQALRLAITGVGAGPDLMITLEIIGKENTVQRLEKALQELATGN
jgi:glutamyl-tRNA synthetase